MMLGIIVGIVGIVVTVISIVVTVINIWQNRNKRWTSKKQPHPPKVVVANLISH